MENNAVFQDIIADYEAARPGYPAELFRDIAAFAGLTSQAEILEIGAGPGQATEYFARSNYSITALEISRPQVDFLQNKFAVCDSFRCVCSTFEEFDCADATYDLIFSATAFHWIKPEIGYPKAFRQLKENGVIAVFWHLASIVEPKTDLLCQVRSIYQKFAPELDDYLTEAEAEALHQRRLLEIQSQGLFLSPVSSVYRWQDVYPTERYLRLMNSYSDFHSIAPEKRNAILREVATLIDKAGGTITIPQQVRLYMARKADSKR
jgi:SAM-dependent methyltransferase